MTIQYKGGYVHQPKPGIHKNVIVLDFRNLYPSIIVTHNIDPTTLDKKNCMRKTRVPGFKRYFCQDKIAPVPKRIKNILEKRWDIKKKLNKKHDTKLAKKEQQLKLAANIAYGYFGYPKSSYYSIKCAESISAFGRHYLQMVIREAGFKFNVIYGDTDSIFFIGNISNAKSFLKEINKKLPGIIKLEFRGTYKKGLFVSGKSGKGTKKKYALLDKNNELEIKGFETQRGDWCNLAKDTQKKVLKYILLGDKKKAISTVKRSINKIKNEKFKLDDVLISVQLTKPIKDYKVKSAHVEVAKKMKSVKEGMLIKYVITKGKGSISERAKLKSSIKNIDKDYYINKQVLPSAIRVLGMFGIKEKDLI